MSHEHVTTGTAAAYAAASGVAIWLEVISGWVGLFAAVSAVILTWVMIRKHWIETTIIKESGGKQKKERRKTKRKVEE